MEQACLCQCAICGAKLIITGVTEGPPDAPRIDESFMLLDRRQGAGGPQQNRLGGGLEESFVVLGPASSVRSHSSQQHMLAQSGLQGGLQAGAAAGVHPHGTSFGPGSGHQQASTTDSTTPGLDAKLQALAQLFELASTTTQADQPLCLDCAAQLKDEIEAQVAETEHEISCYAAAVARLEAEQSEPLPEVAFAQEMEVLRAAQQEQQAAAEATEAELVHVNNQLAALRATEAEIDALEHKYWHDFNEFSMHLKQHLDDRDSMLTKINHAGQRKQLLQSTNVYNDAFKIWHDGPFGTISGFRLGRTPEVPVEWDEINAAWGQAVLLLHTMAQACGLNLTSARLLPMGSHPRVADKRSTYDLFGPVSKLWSANYDRAMICFLACLKEFGEHAARQDVLHSRHPPFAFPFPLEGDKVNSHTIKLTLNKDARWTKALKFMLADLKVALQWMVKHEALSKEVDPNSKLPALRPEHM
ncbi:autophagy protein [Dunaliella salina]|uniref:Autophagy protein n=1 Tax=Dunaliella salina TaxID=3046 RepID=A0ABQ7GY60_DUNSA|nr:autophagy protein [Dunaliella salina]|eukprot:KAF5839533.1 autophagy protein [Dunaliella salina]